MSWCSSFGKVSGGSGSGTAGGAQVGGGRVSVGSGVGPALRMSTVVVTDLPIGGGVAVPAGSTGLWTRIEEPSADTV